MRIASRQAHLREFVIVNVQVPGWLWADGFGSIQDQLRDLVGVGDQREVAGVDLDRRGVHASGEEPLQAR